MLILSRRKIQFSLIGAAKLTVVCRFRSLRRCWWSDSGYSLTRLEALVISAGWLFTPTLQVVPLEETRDWLIPTQSESLSLSRERYRAALSPAGANGEPVNTADKLAAGLRQMCTRPPVTRRFTRTCSWMRRVWGWCHVFAQRNNNNNKKTTADKLTKENEQMWWKDRSLWLQPPAFFWCRRGDAIGPTFSTAACFCGVAAVDLCRLRSWGVYLASCATGSTPENEVICAGIEGDGGVYSGLHKVSFTGAAGVKLPFNTYAGQSFPT